MFARVSVLALATIALGGTGIATLAAVEVTPAERTYTAASPAEDVLDRAIAAYMARMEGIDNYTIVQSVMGMESVIHFEKEMVDGRPRFRSTMMSVGGHVIDSDPDEWEDPYEMLAEYSDKATLRGTETVDGHRVYVVVVDGISELPGMSSDAAGMDEVTFDRGVLYLDVDSYVLRRMEMAGTMNTDGKSSPVTVTGLFEDYRNTQGMLHPFRTTMTMQGADGGISDADRAEARRGMQELRQQLEQMPAAQRQMMENMLASQIERIESMLEGDMEIVVEVKEIRVNAGPPAR